MDRYHRGIEPDNVVSLSDDCQDEYLLLTNSTCSLLALALSYFTIYKSKRIGARVYKYSTLTTVISRLVNNLFFYQKVKRKREKNAYEIKLSYLL